MWNSFEMHSLLSPDWDIKGKRQHGRMSDRMTDRQPDTSPQHKLHWALFPLRRISGELCVGWLRSGHTAQDGQSDCLATVILLGERTWLRGCSWFEMVSGLNPGGHQPGRIGSLKLSFQIFASSGARWLWNDGNKNGAFILTVSSSVGFLQITGSDYIPPSLPCATPFSKHGAPRPANLCQLSVLIAESLSGSWATCHGQENNKEQNSKHRDTPIASVGNLPMHRNVNSSALPCYSEGIQSSVLWMCSKCDDLINCFGKRPRCCTVKRTEGRQDV